MECVANLNVRIMPEVLIGVDGASGGISGLLGLQLLEQVDTKVTNGNGNDTSHNK